MKAISANAVYDTALAYQKTAALIAAVKLDLFTELGRGKSSAVALAAVTHASERGIRILCDYLTVIGFLSKDGSSYGLTPVSSRFLDQSSPSVVSDALDFLAAPEMIALTLDDPVAYVRRGGSPGLASVSPNNPLWVRFARAMVPFAATTAKRVVHNDHMTTVMERFHDSRVDVRVLARRIDGTTYSRKIILVRQDTGAVVQFALAQFDLNAVSEAVRQRDPQASRFHSVVCL